MGDAADTFKKAIQSVVDPIYYPVADYIEQSSRKLDTQPVDKETQDARDSWDALVKAKKDAASQELAPKKNVGRSKDPNANGMTGPRG